MKGMRLYTKFLRVAVLGKVQYKADFLVGLVSVLVLNVVNLSLIGILVYNFHSLGGWGMWDLLFLYSFWMLSRSLYGIFFGQLGEFEELIVGGGFDAYLTRPASPFLQFIGKDIDYSGVGDLLVGILGMTVAWGRLGLSWGLAEWAYFAVCILAGTGIQVAIKWIGASLCFWTVRANAAQGIVERFIVLMQQYPVGIFGKYFQMFVTCFLPVAFINYYPCVVLLGKAQGGIPAWQYLSPAVAVLLLALAGFIWTRGIRRYAGAGN